MNRTARLLEEDRQKRIKNVENKRFQENLATNVCRNLHQLPQEILDRIFQYLPMEVKLYLFFMQNEKKYHKAIFNSNNWMTQYCKFTDFSDEVFINNFFKIAHDRINKLELTSIWCNHVLNILKKQQCPNLKFLTFLSCEEFPLTEELSPVFRNLVFISSPLSESFNRNTIYFDNVVELVLPYSYSDKKYSTLKSFYLPNLPKLQKFTMDEEIDPQELETFLKERPQLTEIKMEMMMLNESHTLAISLMKNMKKLYLMIPKENVSWVHHLSKLNQLEYLNLFFDGSSELIVEFFHLADFPLLTELRLNTFRVFQPNHANIIVTKFDSLQRLTLYNIKNVDGKALQMFKKFKKTLTHLSLIECMGFETKDLDFICKLRKLKVLELRGSLVDDNIITYISKCKKLQHLDISDTCISHHILYHVQKYLKLNTFKSSLFKNENYCKKVERIPLAINNRRN